MSTGVLILAGWLVCLLVFGRIMWRGTHAPYREDELRDRPANLTVLDGGKTRGPRERARRRSA